MSGRGIRLPLPAERRRPWRLGRRRNLAEVAQTLDARRAAKAASGPSTGEPHVSPGLDRSVDLPGFPRGISVCGNQSIRSWMSTPSPRSWWSWLSSAHQDMANSSCMSDRTNQITAQVIQRAALKLFAKYGFETTTVDDIAAAAGIGRRTFYWYYASKNDIPFADMDPLLHEMDEWLSSAPEDLPLLDAISSALVRFNTVYADGVEAHRQRMMLIRHTPALQAHRALRSALWQEVVARFAAKRLKEPLEALAPQFVGQLAVAATAAAYDVWLIDAHADLAALLRDALAMIQLIPRDTTSPLGLGDTHARSHQSLSRIRKATRRVDIK
jgi:TetR/AcrR family transcriptional regulator, regulator of mycofactocin system